MRGTVLQKYLQVMEECKQSAKGISEDQCSLGSEKVVSVEQFWSWANVDAIDGSEEPIRRSERCTYFEKELWLDLVNSVRSKHRSIFQYHVKQTHNDILKPFVLIILQYNQRVREMHDLDNYLPLTLMKGQDYAEAYWSVRDNELSDNDIFVITKDGLPTSIQDEMDKKDKDYLSVSHK